MNLGDEIRNIVQDAVNNRDFNRLNRDIGNVVNGALDEAKRSIDRNRENRQTWKKPHINDTWGNHGQNNQSQPRNDQASNQQRYYQNNRNNYTNAYKQTYNQSKPVPKIPKFTVAVGQVSGTLLTVFGVLGSVVFAMAAAVLGIIGLLIASNALYYTIALGLIPCFLACMVLSMKGSRIRKRLQRFQRYLAQLHGRNYCLIKDFSSATGRSDKYTMKDLLKMIDIGMFPEGHIDDKKTCFMLNNESYQQYLNLQENMRMRDAQEQVKNKDQAMRGEQTGGEKNNKKNTLDPVIRKALEEGRQFVQEIRNANAAIPGEEISRKLDRLEAVTGKIFDYIEIHPEKFPEIKKFTEYFLPTTLKLLDAYREFDYQPVEGENISTAKKEIEKTLDTINLAFENLLDGLFEEAAMDISTDISVLETMFAQEGLTEKNIRV
jgi:5-bromo-4-chloroindolyl phosphate hydrolysis protein